MGRKKIFIKPIVDERARHVTFCKRKTGLLKKAYELSILCQCDIALFVFSDSGRLHQYSSKPIEQLLKQYNAYPKHETYETRTNTELGKLFNPEVGKEGQGNFSDEEDDEDEEQSPSERGANDEIILDTLISGNFPREGSTLTTSSQTASGQPLSVPRLNNDKTSGIGDRGLGEGPSPLKGTAKFNIQGQHQQQQVDYPRLSAIFHANSQSLESLASILANGKSSFNCAKKSKNEDNQVSSFLIEPIDDNLPPDQSESIHKKARYAQNRIDAIETSHAQSINASLCPPSTHPYPRVNRHKLSGNYIQESIGNRTLSSISYNSSPCLNAERQAHLGPYFHSPDLQGRYFSKNFYAPPPQAIVIDERGPSQAQSNGQRNASLTPPHWPSPPMSSIQETVTGFNRPSINSNSNFTNDQQFYKEIRKDLGIIKRDEMNLSHYHGLNYIDHCNTGGTIQGQQKCVFREPLSLHNIIEAVEMATEGQFFNQDCGAPSSMLDGARLKLPSLQDGT